MEEAAAAAAASATELTPEGWAQATRTAWGLRLVPRAFAPAVVLTSSSRSSGQTASRVLALAEDDADVPEAEAPLARPSARAPVRPRAEAVRCQALDFPGAGSLGIAPMVYSLTEAVAKAVEGSENPDEDPGLGDPPAVMLVGGGAALEALVACLNAGLAVPRRPGHLATGRLGGGDAVLLESPVMLRIVGETEEEERVRPPHELWEEALRKSQWEVVKHITGDGRRPWSLPKVCERIDTDPPILEEQLLLPSETREEWRRYVGAPLVLSQGEFAELCERAGSIIQPIGKVTLSRIRPLVNDSFRPWKPVALRKR